MFIESYVQRKVTTWIDKLERLSSIAITQPHAAFAAFTHGLTTYLARTTPNITDLIKPLEETIRSLSTKPHWSECYGEGHAGTTSSSWWTRYFTSLQDECATLLSLVDRSSFRSFSVLVSYCLWNFRALFLILA